MIEKSGGVTEGHDVGFLLYCGERPKGARSNIEKSGERLKGARRVSFIFRRATEENS